MCERHEVRVVRTKHGIERGLVARLQSFEKVAVINVISVRSSFCRDSPVAVDRVPVYSWERLMIRIRVLISSRVDRV